MLGGAGLGGVIFFPQGPWFHLLLSSLEMDETFKPSQVISCLFSHYWLSLPPLCFLSFPSPIPPTV